MITKFAKQQKLGPMIVDVSGHALTVDDERRLAHPNTGGVILFGRNFKSRAQLSKLINAIRAVRSNIIISVDHEGGRVQRFKTDGFAHLPSMRQLGDVYANNPLHGVQVATAAGYVLAVELRVVGVDYSYTPVLDLDYGGSTVIGDRAFSPTPAVVATLAKALLHGMLRAGMVGCGKHFPGHGFVVADSHVDMPIDNRDLKRILAEDVLPYRYLVQDLGAVMPAHVVYPKVDRQAAGFSKVWLDLLREQLHFTGVVVSDDLSMAGAAMIYPNVVGRVGRALDAGCDMVMVCNRPQDLDDALNGLPKSYLRHAHTAAVQRRLARLRGHGGENAVNGWKNLQAHTDYQHARALIAPYLRNVSAIDPTEIMQINNGER